MVEKVETMPYQEAWEKMQGDYLVAMGVLYRYLKDTYGEQGLIDYLNRVEIDRFRKYFKGFTTSLATILEKVAPGKMFERKMREIAREFQFFLGVDNIEILELDSEKGVARMKECPYAKATSKALEEIRTERDIYCKYQCGVYIKGICEQVLGFGISFEPKEVECIYRVKRI